MRNPFRKRKPETIEQDRIVAQMSTSVPKQIGQDEHQERLINERCQYAAAWLKRLPKFPPNTEKLTIVMHYDDGQTLSIEIGEGK